MNASELSIAHGVGERDLSHPWRNRLLFVENRGKTQFWRELAGKLEAAGWECHWIVQNPAYTPANVPSDRIELLPFPMRENLRPPPKELEALLDDDRGVRYYAATNTHYAHYRDAVDAAVDRINPTVVLGEPTLFHERLVIDASRRRGIPFLHPAACRYPNGRMQVLDSWTQTPIGGSGEQWPREQLIEASIAIAERQSVPDYMTRPVKTKVRALVQSIHRQANVLRGWALGEHFNTPSPFIKQRLERRLTERLARWREAAREPTSPDRTILYAMQMQPEANLDLWGRPYVNQVALVRSVLASAPDDVRVAVKVNPRPKYEVTGELLELARTEPRLLLLPLETRIDRARAGTMGAITVTGTIGLEAVFGQGRCVSLRHPTLRECFPDFHADSVEMAVNKLLDNDRAGVGDVERGADLLSVLIDRSWPGVINEPFYDRSCVSALNVERVAVAITDAIAQLA